MKLKIALTGAGLALVLATLPAFAFDQGELIKTDRQEAQHRLHPEGGASLVRCRGRPARPRRSKS